MTQNNEQRLIIEGLNIGNQANHKIADQVASRAATMVDQALSEDFDTILYAKVSVAVQETINVHTERAKAFAKKFLGTSKTHLAKNLVDTQHRHQLASLQSHLDLSELDDFDTDLLTEARAIADEAGAITVETNTDSAIGF